MARRVRLSLIFILTMAVSFGLYHAENSAGQSARHLRGLEGQPSAAVLSALNNLPLHFVENAGQTNPEVKYVLQEKRGNVFFTPREIVFSFAVLQGGNEIQDEPLPSPESASGGVSEENLRIRFLGARPDVKVQAFPESAARFSYFRGSDPQKWVSGARTYEKLQYSGLYTGIDLQISGQAGKLKTEYLVRPEGDPADIAIIYQGAERLEINSGGQLEIAFTGGTLIEDAPECYQVIGGRRVPVEAGYRVENCSTVRLEIGAYRKDAELIIDPVIFATFLGGSSSDYGVAMNKDDSGNFYVAGFTKSTNFPTTGGAYDTTFSGGTYDYFVSKFDATLSSLLYSTFLGGSADTGGAGIVLYVQVDDGDNAYLTGYTDSTDFPTTPGAFDTSHNGSYDAFVTKISAAGSALVFSTYIGGSGNDIGYVIATDDTGGIVAVGGSTFSTDFPTSPGAFDTSHNGGSDGFMTIMNSSGTGLAYSTFFGGTGIDRITDFGADDAGNVYFTGQTSSTDLPATPGAYDTTLNGSNDGYLAKLNSSFTNLAYLTYLGGSGDDVIASLDINEESGEVFVTGQTASTDFPVTSGALDTSYNGGTYDAFVTKVNSAGSSLLYSSYLGGSDSDGARTIAAGNNSAAIIAGYTLSTDFPTTPDADDNSYNGGAGDVFVARISRTGTHLVYSTFLGGISNDDAYRIRSANFGNYLIFGLTSSGNFPVTPGAFDTIQNGMADAFAAVIPVPTESVRYIFDGHDYDGDTASDISVYRPWIGVWYISGLSDTPWGAAEDIPVPGNYDLDTATEIAVFRPSTGLWFIYGGPTTQWGTSVDIPVPHDYNGGGVTDIAVWRPSNGVWYINGVADIQWGQAGDYLVPGDYDGNGVDEPAVWRPTNGEWFIYGGGYYQWGTVGDIPVPADYNGDGKTDIAVYRPAAGMWYIQYSGGGTAAVQWGTATDIPVPGDYDGNGTTDIAIWRPSDGLWYIYGGATTQYGIMGDIPLVR